MDDPLRASYDTYGQPAPSLIDRTGRAVGGRASMEVPGYATNQVISSPRGSYDMYGSGRPIGSEYVQGSMAGYSTTGYRQVPTRGHSCTIPAPVALSLARWDPAEVGAARLMVRWYRSRRFRSRRRSPSSRATPRRYRTASRPPGPSPSLLAGQEQALRRRQRMRRGRYGPRDQESGFRSMLRSRTHTLPYT